MSIQQTATTIKQGMKTKKAVSLKSFVEMSSTLNGRDKLTKLLQYGARFFVWYFQSISPNYPLRAKAFNLYKTTQVSRKAFRILKVLDEVVRLQVALGHSSLSHKHILQAIRAIAMGMFWSFDNLNYLTTTKTIKYGNMRALKGFSRCWTVGSIVLLWLGLESVVEQHREKKKLLAGDIEQGEREERLLKANAAQVKGGLTAVKGICDFLCAINIHGMELPRKFTGKKWNDGIIGALGAVSAFTTIYNSWPDDMPVKSA
ncbi:unnamed protein product [Chrysoparadoxa australica]